MDRGALLGIVSGAVVFILILSFFFYANSSFDQRLIDQVEAGMPAEELYPQIDVETEYLENVAQNRLERVVMDQRYWGDGDLVTSDNYKVHITSYQFEMRVIEDYEKACKRYANREITKREFLSEIKSCKEYYNLYGS